MSTKNHKLKAGLAVCGLIWSSAEPADAQEPLPATPPVFAPDPSPASIPAYAVLLLSNGNVQQGNVSLDKSGEFYLLHQKGGAIRFAKKDVERRFGSIAEL